MDNKSLYETFIEAGMSPEGACALMGNLQAESGLRANNAQNGRSRLTDEEYTQAADEGTIDFVHDSIGYGLAQWTFWSRKQKLMDFAKSRGVSVGDARMQADFCIYELQSDYKAAWDKLCGAGDLYEATARVCTQYEKPAVKNIEARYQYAQRFHAVFAAGEKPGDEPEENGGGIDESCTAELPIVKWGDKNGSVVAAQTLLIKRGFSVGVCGTDGEFGPDTLAAVKGFQAKKAIAADGIIGGETWRGLIRG